MFADMHLLDITRLTALGQPLSYILLAVPFLYLVTLQPTVCVSSTRDPLMSNKLRTRANSPLSDRHLLLGILAGTFVLLQSNAAHMVYLSVSLFHSALSRHTL